MNTNDNWSPFGLPEETWSDLPERGKIKAINLSLRRPREPGDRSATWLRCAMLALGLLAAAAAAVSFQAQYKMVYAAKGVQWAAALEAAIPDAPRRCSLRSASRWHCTASAPSVPGRRTLEPWRPRLR